MVCAQGGRFCGWALYFKDGILSYCHNVGADPLQYLRAPGVLAPGEHDVQFAFTYDGGGWGRGGSATLAVDGTTVASERLERTIAFLVTIGEGFDVGCDLYTTVTEEMPTGANAFTGKIEWVRVDVYDGDSPERCRTTTHRAGGPVILGYSRSHSGGIREVHLHKADPWSVQHMKGCYADSVEKWIR